MFELAFLYLEFVPTLKRRAAQLNHIAPFYHIWASRIILTTDKGIVCVHKI